MKRVFYGIVGRSFYRGEPRETDVASGTPFLPSLPPLHPFACVACTDENLSRVVFAVALARPSRFFRPSTFDPLMRLIRNFISRKKPCLWGSASCLCVCVYIYIKLPCTVIFPLLRDTFPRGARAFRRTGGWCLSFRWWRWKFIFAGESFDFDPRFSSFHSIWREKFSRFSQLVAN